MTAKCNHVIKQTRIVQGHGSMQAIPQTHTHTHTHAQAHAQTYFIKYKSGTKE